MNKPMLSALAAIVFGALTVGPTLAKPAPAPKPASPTTAAPKKKSMADELGLTKAQKAQLKPIMKSQHDQSKAIKADTTLAPAAKKAKMKALEASTDAQLKKVLTPAQMTKMLAMREQRRLARKAQAGKTPKVAKAPKAPKA